MVNLESVALWRNLTRMNKANKYKIDSLKSMNFEIQFAVIMNSGNWWNGTLHFENTGY
jgi:hypothetical protein